MPSYSPKPSDVLERFVRYVRVDTQSDPHHEDQTPSTACQLDLARMLADELEGLGCEGVSCTEHAYVTATLPASEGAQDLPALGLIAHIDTAIDAPASGVAPHIVHYEGGDLVHGERDGRAVVTTPEQLPDLASLVGQDLVCTDGTTLLGADDKAGVAEIMALVARLAAHPELSPPHAQAGLCSRRGDWPRRGAARPRRLWRHVGLHGRRRDAWRVQLGVLLGRAGHRHGARRRGAPGQRQERAGERHHAAARVRRAAAGGRAPRAYRGLRGLLPPHRGLGQRRRGHAHLHRSRLRLGQVRGPQAACRLRGLPQRPLWRGRHRGRGTRAVPQHGRAHGRHGLFARQRLRCDARRGP